MGREGLGGEGKGGERGNGEERRKGEVGGNSTFVVAPAIRFTKIHYNLAKLRAKRSPAFF